MLHSVGAGAAHPGRGSAVPPEGVCATGLLWCCGGCTALAYAAGGEWTWVEPRCVPTCIGHCHTEKAKNTNSVVVAGQRQLICLARVLLRRPQVLLLDECTAHMDPSNAAWMQQVLERFHQEAGCSLVQIAHELRHIEEYDRVLVMDGGTVVEHGKPADLLASGGLFSRLCERGGCC